MRVRCGQLWEKQSRGLGGPGKLVSKEEGGRGPWPGRAEDVRVGLYLFCLF